MFSSDAKFSDYPSTVPSVELCSRLNYHPPYIVQIRGTQFTYALYLNDIVSQSKLIATKMISQPIGDHDITIRVRASEVHRATRCPKCCYGLGVAKVHSTFNTVTKKIESSADFDIAPEYHCARAAPHHHVPSVAVKILPNSYRVHL